MRVWVPLCYDTFVSTYTACFQDQPFGVSVYRLHPFSATLKLAPTRGNDPRLSWLTVTCLTPCQPDGNKIFRKPDSQFPDRPCINRPDQFPCYHIQLTRTYVSSFDFLKMAEILGIEPRLRVSKTPLLPLQHISIKIEQCDRLHSPILPSHRVHWTRLPHW